MLKGREHPTFLQPVDRQRDRLVHADFTKRRRMIRQGGAHTYLEGRRAGVSKRRLANGVRQPDLFALMS